MAVHIGGRAIEEACLLCHRLQLVLAPGCLPVFASDGLNQYFHGMTAHFGFWDKPPRARKFHWFPDPGLQYAQLVKQRHGQKVKFLTSILRLGTRTVFRETLLALELSGLVQTAFVERSNLTLRELIAPLSRRTWSLPMMPTTSGCTSNGVSLTTISAGRICPWKFGSEDRTNIAFAHRPWPRA